MQVVNRVFRGQLNAKPDFGVLQTRCKSESITCKAHSERPRMLCIKRPRGTVILFETGRFRIMGKCNEEEARHLMCFIVQSDSFNLPLHLQTETIKFSVKPLDIQFVRKYDSEILYEPELFPALKLLRWPSVHANLFFSGSVVVLGVEAALVSPDIKKWLDSVLV
jgi:TATA-box binding protein (TBP) (component of TFIID and TFIIIB)